VAFLVALVSTAPAVVPMTISTALALTSIGVGATLIAAVTEDHRRRLAGR
jgi:hypothetical protein